MQLDQCLREESPATKFNARSNFCRQLRCCRTQAISFEGDTVVYAPAGIDTTNLLFVTLPDVRVVFSAPTVTLKRNQASDVGVRSTVWT